MSDKSTKRPWQVLGDDGGGYIRIRGTVLGTKYKVANVLGGEYAGSMEEAKDNARTILACVNACKGLPLDDLEKLVQSGDTLALRLHHHLQYIQLLEGRIEVLFEFVQRVMEGSDEDLRTIAQALIDARAAAQSASRYS